MDRYFLIFMFIALQLAVAVAIDQPSTNQPMDLTADNSTEDSHDHQFHTDELFDCGNGREISSYYVCDGNDDCGNDEDETSCDGHCSKRNCHDGFCIDSKCFCGHGHVLTNGTTCLDVDECATNAHHCDQLCYNRNRGYDCDCRLEYVLDSNDGETCNKVDDPTEAVFYFTRGRQIHSLNLLSNRLKPVVSVRSPRFSHQLNLTLMIRGDNWLFVAADYFNYTANKDSAFPFTKHSSVFQIDLDDLHQSTLELDEENELESQITGIAFDRVQNYLYVAKRDHIQVCAIEGRYCGVLVTAPSGKNINGIVVRPMNDHLFISMHPHNRTQSVMYRAYMDGSSMWDYYYQEDEKDFWEMKGISLDFTESRIIWSDPTLKQIQYCRLDIYYGKRRGFFNETRLTSVPASPVIFKETLFWINHTTNSIQICNITSTQAHRHHCLKPAALFESPQNHTYRLISSIKENYGILSIYYGHNQSLSSTMKNPCTKAGCSHFCYRRSSRSWDQNDFVCGCPTGMELESQRSNRQSRICRFKTETTTSASTKQEAVTAKSSSRPIPTTTTKATKVSPATKVTTATAATTTTTKTAATRPRKNSSATMKPETTSSASPVKRLPDEAHLPTWKILELCAINLTITGVLIMIYQMRQRITGPCEWIRSQWRGRTTSSRVQFVNEPEGGIENIEMQASGAAD